MRPSPTYLGSESNMHRVDISRMKLRDRNMGEKKKKSLNFSFFPRRYLPSSLSSINARRAWTQQKEREAK